MKQGESREEEIMGSQKNTTSTTSSPRKTSPRTLHDLFEQEKPLFPIPSSPTTSANEELLSAVHYCTFVFTFTDPTESPAQRDSKRHQLSRLMTMLKSFKKPMHERSQVGVKCGGGCSEENFFLNRIVFKCYIFHITVSFA